MLDGKPIIIGRTRHGGGGYLRCHQNLVILSRQGLAHTGLITANTSEEDTIKMVNASDIMCGSAIFETKYEGQDKVDGKVVLSSREMIDVWREYLATGRKLLWDVDDDPESISPFNPAYRTFGLEDVEFDEEAGKVFGVPLDEDGKRTLWKAKDGVFDPERNQRNYDAYCALLRECSALSTTTSYLKKKLLRYNPNVIVRPNVLDFRNVWRRRSRPASDGKIRLMYMGGSSHLPDFAFILPVLQAIAAAYPHTIFQFFGDVSCWAKKALPADRIEVYPWEGDYRAFALRMATLHTDIGLCPLNMGKLFAEFNRCKSPLKWLDYAACGIPSVCQRYSPYDLAVNHRELPGGDSEWNGFLADTEDEWYRFIAILVQNADARAIIGENACQDARLNWDAETWGQTYLSQYEDILNGNHDTSSETDLARTAPRDEILTEP